MQQNILLYVFTALVPLLVGFVWYNKALFGRAWMRANRFTESDLKGGNIALRLILTYVLSLMLALALTALVIHQMHLFSTLANQPGMKNPKDPNSPAALYLKDFMTRFGSEFRTFRHGAFHGTIAGLFVAMPIIGIIALSERRSFKYVAIHTGYWMMCLALMGGLICQFMKLG